MEATCSSETSVDFQRTTCRYSPDDRTSYNHRWENLKPYMDERDLNINLFNKSQNYTTLFCAHFHSELHSNYQTTEGFSLKLIVTNKIPVLKLSIYHSFQRAVKYN
jgi:hypothetical protein